MKTIQLILIFAFVSYCFTQSDECTTEFESRLQSKCTSIDTTCRFTDNENQRCLPKNSCGIAENDDDCRKIIPDNYHKKKCSWELKEEGGTARECKEVDKVCTDYNLAVNGIEISGDDCGELKADSNDEKCQLSWDNTYNRYICTSHFKQCSKASDAKCNTNIPEDLDKKCKYDNTKDPKCTTEKRLCTYADSLIFKYMAENICPSLQLQQSSGTKCIYNSGGTCYEENISCSSYFSSGNENLCNDKKPLNQTGKDYDNENICQYISGTGGASDSCIAVKRTCSQFIGPDALTCTHLSSTNSNKRCVYDTSGSPQCREEYSTCELYSSNEIEKDREGCEKLIMLEENKKCVYIPEEDKCETRQIYEKCDAYEGNDRKICESIISPTTNSYCILDKDSKCKDRVPYCSEIPDGNKEECIFYAKPMNANKRCAYNDSTTATGTGLRCYEEYARCEDYLGTSTTSTTTLKSECEGIRLYNGYSCEYLSDRCRSTNKVCEEALTKEECKLINVTGVSDPDKKVCDFIGGQCKENYKYCSDLREVKIEPGASADAGDVAYYDELETKCSNIKPYDESGKNIDIYSKCVYESGVGCQRVPKDCEDAGDNPILCKLFSDIIKDKSVKYCVFTNGDCKEQFKNCKDVTGDFSTATGRDKCEKNIIENYITNECKVDTSSSPLKCVRKNDCASFSEDSYEEICKNINPNCSYIASVASPHSPGYCITTTNDCEDIIFYEESEGNEAVCKSMEASVPYKICSLKEDKSGCEEIYRDSPYSLEALNRQDDSSSSSEFIARRIHIILLFLCFLF